MYGLVIWLSQLTNSALLVTDWGSHLTYGPKGTEKIDTLTVGDLVYIEGAQPDQQEISEGLTLIWPGYNPQVKEFLATASMHHFISAFTKTGNFKPQPLGNAAVNQTAAPNAARARKFEIIQPDFG